MQFKVLCHVLRKIFTDRIAQVIQAGVRLLSTALDTVGDSLKRSEIAGGIDSVLPELTLKASETNPRVKEAAREALLLLARNQKLGPSYIGRALVENVGAQLKKNSRNWKEGAGKLEFLGQFLTEFGPDDANEGRQADDRSSSSAFTVSTIMKVAIEGVKNPNGQTRAMAVEVVAILYGYVGLAVERYLGELTPVQTDAIHSAFQRADRRINATGLSAGPGRPDEGGGGGEQQQRAPARERGATQGQADDPFAARPKVGNSFESSGSGQNCAPPQQHAPAGRPPSGRQGGGGAGGGQPAPSGDDAEAFAAKPKVRNSFEGDSRPGTAGSGSRPPSGGGHLPYDDGGGGDQYGGPADDAYGNEHGADEEIPPAALEAFDRGTALFEESDGNEELCAEAVDAFSTAIEAGERERHRLSLHFCHHYATKTNAFACGAIGHPDVASCLTERCGAVFH